MKKKYDDLTIGDIEKILESKGLCKKDENGEWPCRNGCNFHFEQYGVGCCFKVAFFNHLWDFLESNEKIKLTDESGDWEIDIPDEILEE